MRSVLRSPGKKLLMTIEPATITLRTKPHIERGGYHTDRFDAYVGSEHIVLSRQPAYDGARKLIAKGYDPDTLVVIAGEDSRGKPNAPWPPQRLGELAKWTVWESDKGGLERREWRPFIGGRRKEGARTPIPGP